MRRDMDVFSTKGEQCVTLLLHARACDVTVHVMFAAALIGLPGTNSGFDKRRAAGTREEVLQQTSQKLREAGVYVHFDYS